MARSVTPEDMREYLASGNVNKKRNKRNKAANDMLCAALVASDPEMAQIVTAAALCFSARNVDQFAKDSGLDEREAFSVKLWLRSLATLATNGAMTMQTMQEVFGD
jgi:hypothetical protein